MTINLDNFSYNIDDDLRAIKHKSKSLDGMDRQQYTNDLIDALIRVSHSQDPLASSIDNELKEDMVYNTQYLLDHLHSFGFKYPEEYQRELLKAKAKHSKYVSISDGMVMDMSLSYVINDIEILQSDADAKCLSRDSQNFYQHNAETCKQLSELDLRNMKQLRLLKECLVNLQRDWGKHDPNIMDDDKRIFVLSNLMDYDIQILKNPKVHKSFDIQTANYDIRRDLHAMYLQCESKLDN